MNEHLVEALRRLRKNSSETNVDRRLVTNIVLSFITTPRGDTKRFEMLNLLSSILSWGDAEREKAGLQKQQPSSGGGGGGALSPPAATGFWGRSLSSGGQSASVFKTPDIAKSDETEVRCLPSFPCRLPVLTP
jgi:GRAB domain